MKIALGIDTGGTYTDAVLINHDTGVVLAGTKSLTTRHDLALGIGDAIQAVFTHAREHGVSPADVDLVGLSTTLATNAIVENQGCPVCLLLIGYDPDLIQKYEFEQALVTHNVVYIRGGHHADGDEVEPLDETSAKEAILAWHNRVEAFAVSGYFGVRNPAHELRVRALIEELTGQAKPVTCGHELTTQLDSIRRATTAALNARLIPLLRELIVTMRHTLDALGITAPLMIVKGDGSLVRTEWALHRPIETILSGPAASVVGAWHLAGRRDVWVVDVGGTTTDMAMLQGGLPKLHPEGARVGGWRTMVEAVDIHTVGLGGDSQIHLNGSHVSARKPFGIGPRRVIPLCLLSSQYPNIVDELRWQMHHHTRDMLAGQFVLAQRQALHTLETHDTTLLQRLANGPQTVVSLDPERRMRYALISQIEDLMMKRLITYAGFTPTDALHVLGRFDRWDRETSLVGAELLAAQVNLSSEEFCRQIVTDVSGRIATELVRNVLHTEEPSVRWHDESATSSLLTRALTDSSGSALDCQIHLKQPIIAIGAPVEAYMPQVAEWLHTELIIPQHADVANAVGAIAGGVVQRMCILIQVLEDLERSIFRVYLPDGICDFEDLDQAVTHTQNVMSRHMEVLTREAGAEHVDVAMIRCDHRASIGQGAGDELYLSTELHFTATGRPGVGRKGEHFT